MEITPYKRFANGEACFVFVPLDRADDHQKALQDAGFHVVRQEEDLFADDGIEYCRFDLEVSAKDIKLRALMRSWPQPEAA